MRLWPFGRRKAAPEQPPETDHDWAVGDLGECINGNWRGKEQPAALWVPREGDLIKVTEIEWSTGKADHVAGLYLGVRAGDDYLFHASHFRKLVIQHEPASAEFTAKLRDRKTVWRPVPEPASRRSEPAYGRVDNGRIRFVPA